MTMPDDDARAAIEHLRAALGRQMAAMSQMVNRSGPIYDTARERSRIVHEAWRAAGSPRHVQRIHTADGVRYFTDPPARTLATEAQSAAWNAWRRERDRLRRELRA
jgi:hypothetical protein